MQKKKKEKEKEGRIKHILLVNLFINKRDEKITRKKRSKTLRGKKKEQNVQRGICQILMCWLFFAPRAGT